MGKIAVGNPERIQVRIAHNQRKLIPLNIFVMILALVAAVSLLVAPLFTVDIGAAAETLGSLYGEESEADSSQNESSQSQIFSEVFGSINYKISFTTYKLVKFATASDRLKYAADGIAGFISDVSATLFVDIAALYVRAGLSEQSSGFGLNELDVSLLNGILEPLERAESAADVEAVAGEFAVELQSRLGKDKISDADIGAVSGKITELYEFVTVHNDGYFNTEACICIVISDFTGADDTLYSYGDLVNALLFPENPESKSILSSIGDYVEKVADYVQYAVYAISAIILSWLVLFAFAFFRIFTKNKRFTMWYAKLLGGLPCLIFGVIPLCAPMIVKSFLSNSEKVTAMAGLFSALGTLAWISGVCYALLWLASAFWAYPVKRKIRRDKKVLAKFNA